MEVISKNIQQNNTSNMSEYLAIKKMNESISKTRHFNIDSLDIPEGIKIKYDLINSSSQPILSSEEPSDMQAAQPFS